MKSIGSHPGAILFRMSIMVILIAILMVVFLFYVDKSQKNIELASIFQTRKIINSSLVVMFATYAARGRLDKLNDLDGANPFEILRGYQLLPATYVGEIEHDLNDRLTPGWYYLRHRRQVVYKPLYIEKKFRFELLLKYDDVDGSGHFHPETDKFKGIYFVEVTSL